MNSVPGQFPESENSVALEICVPVGTFLTPGILCEALSCHLLYIRGQLCSALSLFVYLSSAGAIREGVNTESRTDRHFGKVCGQTQPPASLLQPQVPVIWRHLFMPLSFFPLH